LIDARLDAPPLRADRHGCDDGMGDRIADACARGVAFARRRVVEICIVAAALGIRIALFAVYNPALGYDATDHFRYVEWFTQHLSLPDLMLSRVTYHPPLYYAIAGGFARLAHATRSTFGLPSLIFAGATVLVVWAGLERFVRSRRARIVGLVLAAVLPAGVHLAAMASAEALNGLLATAALLLAAEALQRQRRGERIVWRAALIGLLMALEMLTKISAIATIAAIGAAVAFECLAGQGDLAGRLRRAVPWLVAAAVLVGASGWYFARNQRLYGKAVLSGFDGPDGKGPPPVDASYLKRRPPEFFVGWTDDVFRYPYYPSGVKPRSYFWPVAMTSTFVDYYSFGFVAAPKSPAVPAMIANDFPLPRASLPFAQASAVGGAVIALTTAIAWLWAVIVCLRRRASPQLALLAAPAFALVGLLHLVVKYPYDFAGTIKGVYLQFAMAPLFGLFGLAVYKMMRRRATWPLAIVQCAALLAVAIYTIYAQVSARV
jgi:4-amino-4-deoxy-L-arabinose transferase-like glycosyltransferase